MGERAFWKILHSRCLKFIFCSSLVCIFLIKIKWMKLFYMKSAEFHVGWHEICLVKGKGEYANETSC